MTKSQFAWVVVCCLSLQLGARFSFAGDASTPQRKSNQVAVPIVPQVGPDGHDPKAAYGIDKNGYWENPAKMEELKQKDPENYKKTSARSQALKSRVEQQMAEDGGVFKGLKPTPEEKKILEKLSAGFQKHKQEVDAAQAAEAAGLSGKDIPKELKFRGKQEHLKGPKPSSEHAPVPAKSPASDP